MLWRRGIQKQIVRNKALAPCRQFLLLDHRMPAFDNFQIARVRFVGFSLELRPAIIPQRRNVRQAAEHIHFRQCQRGLPDALGLRGNRRAQLGKQPPLDLDNLFLGVQNLRLVLLQLRSGEALGIHQRLLALVVGGRVVQVRLRNLDVVAENRIELYLERPDSGALALAQSRPAPGIASSCGSGRAVRRDPCRCPRRSRRHRST